MMAFVMGEMLFIQSIEAVFLDIVGKNHRSITYSILSFSTAIGESLGASTGVLVYGKLNLWGHGQFFWLLMSLCALLFSTIVFFTIKKTPFLMKIKACS